MPKVKLDHCVVHVSDWQRSNTFYRDVLGAELIQRGKGWAYRFGDTQLNCHGPGLDPTPVAHVPVQPGNSDLCFEWPGPIGDAKAHGNACRRDLRYAWPTSPRGHRRTERIAPHHPRR